MEKIREIEKIRKIVMKEPFDNPRLLIGYKRGKPVFMTERAFRKVDLKELCKDKSLHPVRNRRHRRVPYKPLDLGSLPFWAEILLSVLKFIFTGPSIR